MNKQRTKMKFVSPVLSFKRIHYRIRQLLTFILVLYLLSGPIITSFYSINHTPTITNNPRSRLAGFTNLNLTWTSRFNLKPTPISPGDRIAGDHIIVKAEWFHVKDINWTRLVVNASAIPAIIEKETQTNKAELDTRTLGNNATCVINVTAGLMNGSILTVIFHDVFFGNFFKPNIVVLSPNGGEVWTGVENITWQAWDLNEEEDLTYEVQLYSDSEQSTQLLSSKLTQTWLEWDFSNLVNLSTYKVIVHATDGIYTSTDFSDDFFTAGLIYPTTSTITGTTTSTTTTKYDIRVVGFLIALIASSIFIALIAYYKAKEF
jgi:hypothetical protein